MIDAYYVSAVKGDQWRALVGPFERHEDALSAVDPAIAEVIRRGYDVWGVGFGTMRASSEDIVPLMTAIEVSS